MEQWRDGIVAIDEDDFKRTYQAQILGGSERQTPAGTQGTARFTPETARRIVEESNQTYADFGFADRLVFNEETEEIAYEIDGSTGSVSPDADGMYRLNPWGGWDLQPAESHALSPYTPEQLKVLNDATERITDIAFGDSDS